MRNAQKVWQFNTKRFEIALWIAPEEMDPADSFQFDEDIEAVNNGDVEWFSASIVVTKDGHEIGSDHLGGNAYKTVEEFYSGHRDPDPSNRNSSIMRKARGDNVVICHYFPDMVTQAITEARRTLS